KVLCGGFSAKGAVWAIGVVAVLEGVDERIELVEAVGQVVDGIELITPGAVAALDGAVELGAFGGQDVEGDGALSAGVLELGHELGSAVHLDSVDLEGHVGDELVEEGCGGGGGGSGIGLGDGPLGDGVVGGEVLEVLAGGQGDGEGVELDDLAGARSFGGLGQALSEAAFRSEEHTSELQSRENLVCRLLLEKKN